MKIVCTSDIHGYLPEIPECDLLLIAGDICPRYDHSLEFQQLWLNTNFSTWLKEVPAKKVVFIAGNHDFAFEEGLRFPSKFDEPMAGFKTQVYLQDQSVEAFGLKIYGSPWQRRFYDWAFNLDTPELDKVFDKIPKCDILITHSPPYGYGDSADRVPEGEAYVPGKVYPQELTGSKRLLEKIQQIQPKLHVFGHIHKGAGVYQIGKTISINATFVNEKYVPTHEPYIVEIDI